MRLSALISAGLCFGIAFASAEPSADFPSNMPQTPRDEKILDIPAADRSITLQTTVFTPAGAGPFPLAVLNHGAPREGRQPRDEPRYRISFSID